MDVIVVTTGAIRHAKLQSNSHHQQTDTQLFTGHILFLLPNQQCQSTEGKSLSRSFNVNYFHWCTDFLLSPCVWFQAAFDPRGFVAIRSHWYIAPDHSCLYLKSVTDKELHSIKANLHWPGTMTAFTIFHHGEHLGVVYSRLRHGICQHNCWVQR